MDLKDLLKGGKATSYVLIGMRGRVGDLVFRRLKSGTYISRRPKKPATQTPGTQRGMERFRRATEFAKKQISDPERKAYYQQIAAQSNPRVPNAYTAAIKEYMNRPETVIEKSDQQQKTVTAKPVLIKRKDTLWYQSLMNRGPLRRSTDVLRRRRVYHPELRAPPQSGGALSYGEI